MEKGFAITAQKIKCKLLGIVAIPKMILEVFREHNEQIKVLLGHELREAGPLTGRSRSCAVTHYPRKANVADVHPIFRVIVLPPTLSRLLADSVNPRRLPYGPLRTNSTSRAAIRVFLYRFLQGNHYEGKFFG